MFLEPATHGFICWHCGGDTDDYSSPGTDELCRSCDVNNTKDNTKSLTEIRKKENEKIRKAASKCWANNDTTSYLIWMQALNES